MAWRRGKPYGQDLRDRVLATGDAPLREVAARFEVSPSYVSKARARLRRFGESTPGRRSATTSRHAWPR
jgi:Mn-dependent DtxR family transcriptional regulator